MTSASCGTCGYSRAEVGACYDTATERIEIKRYYGSLAPSPHFAHELAHRWTWIEGVFDHNNHHDATFKAKEAEYEECMAWARSELGLPVGGF